MERGLCQRKQTSKTEPHPRLQAKNTNIGTWIAFRNRSWAVNDKTCEGPSGEIDDSEKTSPFKIL